MSKKNENGRVFLSADEILALDDKAHEDVYVPEWDSHVRIQVMGGFSRDAWEMEVYRQNEAGGFENIRATLVARCAVHPDNGKRIFSEKQVKALGEKSGRALDRLFEVAQRLNGITDEDVEELEKNSATDQSDDSGSS